MLGAPQTIHLHELGVAEKTPVLVAIVLSTPQAAGIPELGVTDETCGDREVMSRAAFSSIFNGICRCDFLAIHRLL